MYQLIGILLCFNVLLILVVFLRHWAIEKSFRKLKKLSKELEQNKSKSQPGNLRYRMVVEVSDPLGVAQRESKLAGLIKNTAPDIVIRKVYDQVVERTIKQLKKEDVEADVKLEVF